MELVLQLIHVTWALFTKYAKEIEIYDYEWCEVCSSLISNDVVRTARPQRNMWCNYTYSSCQAKNAKNARSPVQGLQCKFLRTGTLKRKVLLLLMWKTATEDESAGEKRGEDLVQCFPHGCRVQLSHWGKQKTYIANSKNLERCTPSTNYERKTLKEGGGRPVSFL